MLVNMVVKIVFLEISVQNANLDIIYIMELVNIVSGDVEAVSTIKGVCLVVIIMLFINKNQLISMAFVIINVRKDITYKINNVSDALRIVLVVLQMKTVLLAMAPKFYNMKVKIMFVKNSVIKDIISIDLYASNVIMVALNAKMIVFLLVLLALKDFSFRMEAACQSVNKIDK